LSSPERHFLRKRTIEFHQLNNRDSVGGYHPLGEEIWKGRRLNIVGLKSLVVDLDTGQERRLDIISKPFGHAWRLFGTCYDKRFTQSRSCHTLNQVAIDTRADAKGEEVGCGEIVLDEIEDIPLGDRRSMNMVNMVGGGGVRRLRLRRGQWAVWLWLELLGALAPSRPHIAPAPLAVVAAIENARFAVSDASCAIQLMISTALYRAG
jgi:hypothetical protein